MCFSESCKRGSKIQCSLLQLWHYYDSLWVLLHDSKKILEIRPLMKTVKCLDSIFPKWFNQFPLFFNRKEYNYLLRTFCHFSCVWLFAALWTVVCQAPLSMGFSRQESWSELPCPPPGDLPNPGMEPTSLMSPALAGGFLTTITTRTAQLPSRIL